MAGVAVSMITWTRVGSHKALSCQGKFIKVTNFVNSKGEGTKKNIKVKYHGYKTTDVFLKENLKR